MGILSFLFGDSKANKTLPFNEVIRFARITSDFKIEIGDEVNIWSKPNSNLINLYVIGSVGGNGLVGTANNKFINFQLENTENLFVENEVVGLGNSYIDLKIKMYVDKEAIFEIEQRAEAEWAKKILSKYNPKANWSLRFYSETKLLKENIFVKSVEKENVKKYYNNTKDLIWLENKDGDRLQVENTAYSADIIKTLRATYSGHQIEIKFISKDRNYYTLEIGTSK